MMVFLSTLPTEEDIPKFNLFYNKYKSLMGKIAFDHIHDVDLSEDCVHECMLYFAENFDKIEDVNSKRTLGMVIRLTKERAINIYNRQLKISSNETPVLSEEELPCLDDNIFDSFDTRELSEAILKLPEKYSTVLIMKAHYGFSYAEISSFLGITEATARKRFERAKAMLADLEPHGTDGEDE